MLECSLTKHKWGNETKFYTYEFEFKATSIEEEELFDWFMENPERAISCLGASRKIITPKNPKYL